MAYPEEVLANCDLLDLQLHDNVTFLSGFKILGLMAKYTDMSLKYAGGLLVMPTTTIVQQKNSSVWFFVPYMLQG